MKIKLYFIKNNKKFLFKFITRFQLIFFSTTMAKFKINDQDGKYWTVETIPQHVEDLTLPNTLRPYAKGGKHYAPWMRKDSDKPYVVFQGFTRFGIGEDKLPGEPPKSEEAKRYGCQFPLDQNRHLMPLVSTLDEASLREIQKNAKDWKLEDQDLATDPKQVKKFYTSCARKGKSAATYGANFKLKINYSSVKKTEHDTKFVVLKDDLSQYKEYKDVEGQSGYLTVYGYVQNLNVDGSKSSTTTVSAILCIFEPSGFNKSEFDNILPGLKKIETKVESKTESKPEESKVDVPTLLATLKTPTDVESGEEAEAIPGVTKAKNFIE